MKERKGRFMKHPMWARRTLVRYFLLQFPGIVLVGAVLLLVRRFLGLSLEWVAVLWGLWVAKDLLLYPLVWRAYEKSDGAK